ncbi:MAG: hypothetical protein P1U58_09805 [Verrucomicrobiales bacterium]|nr:hypothetical protein [Verrucomicrobiales bacterium]
MAIVIKGEYSKRLGLPGYSSHQYSISVETELSDPNDIPGEASKMYSMLQNSVDHEIQQTGFVPGESYGLPENGSVQQNGNGSGHAPERANLNGNGQVRWSCSDKQRELIGNLMAENNLDPASVEEIAFDRFGVGMPQLNKIQASALISEIFAITEKRQRSHNGSK